MTWNKPLPVPTPVSAPYWEGLKGHEVCIQQCTDKGHWFFFPRIHCPVCGSRSLVWRTVSGRGTLHAFTVARVPTMPEFADEMPQILAVVELEEGPHINTTIAGADPSSLRIGEPVRPVFDDRPGTQTLLRYTPVDSPYPSVIKGEALVKPVSVPQAGPSHKIDVKDIDAIRGLISDTFSDWSNELKITQDLVNEFAEISGDKYWLHTDPDRARRESPFGTTIAHGFLTLILISRLRTPQNYEITGFRNMANYGLDRVRFTAPVPVGARIHARSRVKEVGQRKNGLTVILENNIHVVGMEQPSVICDMVVLYMI